jgi:protein SCO1/2
MLTLACLIFIGMFNHDQIISQNDKSTGKALIGGAFELTDQNGKPFSSEQLKGKKSLVFFGFTHCPSICPTGLAQITAVMEKLDADKVQPVFITVDPERDTAERMKEYLADFYPSFVGLTGSLEQLESVKKAYKVYAAKTADEHSGHDYNMDHSSLIYVMDENGEYLTHFSGQETAEEMAGRIGG